MRTDGHKSERQGCDLDTLLEILFFLYRLYRASRVMLFQHFQGFIGARSGNHGLEVEFPVRRAEGCTNINMNSKHITLPIDRFDMLETSA